MDKLRIYLLLLFIALLGLICIWLAGCDDDNPVKSPLVVAADYIAYMYAEDGYGGGLYYTFHTRTKQLDSFIVDSSWGNPSDLDVSADGKRLYISLPDMIAVVDTGSYEVRAELPYAYHQVSISPNNEYIALRKYEGDLYILNTQDYSVIWHDTDSVRPGVFSADGNRYYTSVSGSVSPYVYCVDLAHGNTVTRTPMPDDFPITQVLVSLDERLWFLYRQAYMDTYVFDVYDVDGDSILFRQVLHPGAGSMALSRDGKYVYYTDCGTMISVMPPNYSFAVYDIEARTIDSVVSRPSDSGDPGLPFICQDPVITPDGRFLISLLFTWGPRLLGYSLVKDTVHAYVYLGATKSPMMLTCQNSP